MTFEDLLTRVAQITAAVDVPISVDIESGYGEPPTRLIDGLLGGGRRRAQHRGHRAQRGQAAALGERARRAGRRAAQGGRRRGRARGRQRPHRPVPAPGRRRIRPGRPRHRPPEAGRGAGADSLYPVGQARPGHVAPAWPPSCRCRSTRSRCRIRTIRRRSARSVSAGSASARSSSGRWPSTPRDAGPLGLAFPGRAYPATTTSRDWHDQQPVVMGGGVPRRCPGRPAGLRGDPDLGRRRTPHLRTDTSVIGHPDDVHDPVDHHVELYRGRVSRPARRIRAPPGLPTAAVVTAGRRPGDLTTDHVDVHESTTRTSPRPTNAGHV